MSTIDQNCPTLNATYKGKLLFDGLISQFQNVKYAEIPGRWEKSRQIMRYPVHTTFDNTEPGPQCPQPTQNGDDEYFQIPAELRIPILHQQSEFNCLTVKITGPTKSESLYPVMLFIHGGANVGGTAYNPVHDPANLVRYSIDQGKPIVVVNANYRLGYLGLLAKHHTGNFTFRDLEVCTKWVKSNIKQFGGDPENINMVGESAGSMDIHALAVHNPKMHLDVRRISLISGITNVSKLVSIEEKEKEMNEIRHTLNTNDLSKLDASVLSKRSRSGNALVNDGFFPQPIDILKIAPFEKVLMLDCQNEYVALGLDEERQAKIGDISELEKTQLGKDIKETYGITGNTVSDWKKLKLAYSDFIFAAPANRLYESIRSNRPDSASYIYYDLPGPYNQSIGAHHSLPVLMLFRNYKMDDIYVRQSNKLRDIYLNFCYGIESWDPDFHLNFTPDAGKDISRLLGRSQLNDIRNTNGWKVINKYPADECRELMEKLWN